MPFYWLNFPVPSSCEAIVGSSYSNRFTSSIQQRVAGIVWYRCTGSPFPNKVYLADPAAPNTPVWTWTPSPTDWVSMGGNWYRLPNVSPYDPVVPANQERAITAYAENVGTLVPSTDQTVTPTEYLTLGNAYTQGADAWLPANQATAGTHYVVSPYFGTAPQYLEPPGPDPAANTLGELAIWLQHGNPLLRADSLAKLAYDWLQADRVLLDAIKAKTDVLPFPLNLLTDTWLQAREDDIDSILAQVANLQSRLVGTTGGGGSAFFSSDGRQVAETVAELQDAVSAGPDLTQLREWLTLSPDLDDTSRWTSNGVVTGTGDNFVGLQADVYRVTLTAIPPKHPTHPLPGGAVWVPRIAWCSPQRNGANGWRHYLEFGDNLVHDRGVFMAGLTVYAGPGVDWSVNALILDRAAP